MFYEVNSSGKETGEDMPDRQINSDTMSESLRSIFNFKRVGEANHEISGYHSPRLEKTLVKTQPVLFELGAQ